TLTQHQRSSRTIRHASSSQPPTVNQLTTRATSYTELNVAIANRTAERPFDFDRPDERAAMGYLLFLIVERSFAETGLMLSALVQYLDANDAGPGFYALAADKGLLPRKATADQRMEFWLGQVKRLHRLYAPSASQELA
ncbi:hypothetical protein AB0E69_17145, partial [Kribbella sp. NPDC026611]|uniref:hypothetical protein n=1 Tax=Kribbella sp. NPDC026611 TaxID=3154911 RepID=UPI0033D81B46